MTGRTKSAFINVVVIIIMQVMSFVYSLISKNIFLNSFSLSAYGVVDLFSSFFNSLMLLELGFGTILIYNLYKPVATDNIQEIKKQLSIFKGIYSIVSGIVIAISVTAIPFLYFIFNISYPDIWFVYEVYILNIINVLIKYHFLNKISILSAGRTKYVENISIIFVDFLSFILRIISVAIYKNIYVYFFAQLFLPSLAYVIESIWVDKKYELGKIRRASFLEIKKSGAIKQCKKYIYGTIYSLVFSSMDNIIISAMLSTDAVAYTTNYNSIINTGSQAVFAIMFSLRGIIADYNNEVRSDSRMFEMFDIMLSFNFFMTSMLFVGFYSLIDDFISLWIGKEYIISKSIVIALLLIRVLDIFFEPLNSITVIKGYFLREKISLILSAATNIVLTILLIKHIGLLGAYIGTIIALMIRWIGKMYYVLNGVFNNFKFNVLTKHAFYFGTIILEAIIIGKISDALFYNVNSLMIFVTKAIIVVLITLLVNICIILLNGNVREYIKNMFVKAKEKGK